MGRAKLPGERLAGFVPCPWRVLVQALLWGRRGSRPCTHAANTRERAYARPRTRKRGCTRKHASARANTHAHAQTRKRTRAQAFLRGLDWNLCLSEADFEASLAGIEAAVTKHNIYKQ